MSGGRGPFSLSGLPLPSPPPPRPEPSPLSVPDLAAPAALALPTALRLAAPRLALTLTPVQTFHSACWDGGEGGLGKRGRNSSKGSKVVPNIQKEVPLTRIALLRVGAKHFFFFGALKSPPGTRV